MNTASPKDVGGVGVDRVMVGQATREMASGVRTRDESAAELQRQENAVAQIIDERMKVQRRLSELSDGNKGKLHANTKYFAINEEKVKLKTRLTELELRLSTEKRTLYRMKDERREHRHPDDGGLKQVIVSLRTEMREMKLLLNQILEKVK